MNRLPADARMFNTQWIEFWPACLLDANGDLSRRPFDPCHWVLRDKRSGQFVLAFDTNNGLSGDMESADAEFLQRAHAAISEFENRSKQGAELSPASTLQCLDDWQIDAKEYARKTGLTFVTEPRELSFAGFDRYQRSLWLTQDAAVAWNEMREDAGNHGVVLEAISGYRSHFYQIGIFNRKLERGQTIAEILHVNAAPGFSEHHSGLALDIGTTDEPPAEESFEMTEAFVWLSQNADKYGFTLSYPRDNPHGITYEPWHWAFTGRSTA